MAGIRSSPSLSLIKISFLWMSKTFVLGFCPAPSLPLSGWVLRSGVLTLVFVHLLVLLLARGGAMSDYGSTSLGIVQAVFVLSLLNRLVLILLDLAGPKKLHALMRS